MADYGLEDNQQEPAEDIFEKQSDRDRKIAEKVNKDIAKAMPRVMGQRQESDVAEQAYDGHQWDEMDKMRLEQLRRPTIVFNEIKPTINAVSGIERLNRAEIRFVSRPLDSPEEIDLAGDLLTESYHSALDLSNGEFERSRAIKDMSIGGMGWVEISMDYECDPDGRIKYERLPWREMIWDTTAKRENIEDRRWCARKRDMPREEFKRRWPKKKDVVDQSGAEYPETDIGKYELVTPYYSVANEKANPQVTNADALKDSVTVIQYQCKEKAVVYRFADKSGKMEEMREKEWKKFEERAELLGMEIPFAVRQQKSVYMQYWVAKGILLEEPTEVPGGFGFQCVTGEWDDNKKVWYGIVRPLLDPQRTMNKSMSTALTIFLTNAKGGVMFETGAFTDPQMAKNQWARPDAWIELAQGGAEKIVQREGKVGPTGVELFFTESKAAMNYVSGIPQDMLGVAIGDATAPVMSKRVQAALSVLGWYFDNITRFRKIEARTMAEFIREFWTQGQLIRVGGDYNAQAIPLLKSNLPVQYDMMLDDSVKHNPNLKAQVWQDLQPIIPALLKFNLGRMLLKVLKYTPLPAQLVSEIQKEAEEQMKNPPEEHGRGKKEDPALTAAKIAKMQAETQREMAETEQSRAEAQAIAAGTQHRIAETILEAIYRGKELDLKQEEGQNEMFNNIMDGLSNFLNIEQNAERTEVQKKQLDIKAAQASRPKSNSD